MHMAALFLLLNAGLSTASMTPYSGSLPRPIIFVHGISSNGYGTWGVRQPYCKDDMAYDNFAYSHETQDQNDQWTRYATYRVRCQGVYFQGTTVIDPFDSDDGVTEKFTIPYTYTTDGDEYTRNFQVHKAQLDWVWNDQLLRSDDWENGYVSEYLPESTPAYLAGRYGLSTYYNAGSPATHINNNGLELFNLSQSNPWQHPSGQADILFQKLISVLDEYYGDWRTNGQRKIDLVSHSQGGLVIRSCLKKYKATKGSANPLNHINHIITVDTPHLGTAFAHNQNGVPSMEGFRDWVLNKLTRDYDFPIFWGLMRHNLAPKAVLDPLLELDDNAQHLRYPCGLSNPAWSPSTSYVRSTPISGNCSEYLQELVSEGYPRNPDGGPVAMTALYGQMKPDQLVAMIESYRAPAKHECKVNQFLIIDPNIVSGGECQNTVDRLFNGMISHVNNMSADWIPNSDFVVDVSSQVGEGLFSEKRHPFRKKAITPLSPAFGTPHIHVGTIPGTNTTIVGAAWHGEEIYQALMNPPRPKMNPSILALLLGN